MSGEKDLAAQLFQVKADLALEHGLNVDERSLKIVGEIDEKVFSDVDAKLALLEGQGKGAVIIRVNSEGGSPYAALAIVGRMQRSKCKIIVEAYGCVMSAAVLILAAGDKRRMHNLAWFMTHESSYITEGKHTDIKQLLVQSEREEMQWAEAMGKFSTKSPTYWRLMNSGHDKYLSASECLEAGVIDEIF